MGLYVKSFLIKGTDNFLLDPFDFSRSLFEFGVDTTPVSGYRERGYGSTDDRSSVEP